MGGLKNVIVSRPRQWSNYLLFPRVPYQVLIDGVWFGEITAGETLNMQIPASAKRLVVRLVTYDRHRFQSRVFDISAVERDEVCLRIATHHAGWACLWFAIPYIGPFIFAAVISKERFWRKHLKIAEMAG